MATKNPFERPLLQDYSKALTAAYEAREAARKARGTEDARADYLVFCEAYRVALEKVQGE